MGSPDSLCVFSVLFLDQIHVFIVELWFAETVRVRTSSEKGLLAGSFLLLILPLPCGPQGRNEGYGWFLASRLTVSVSQLMWALSADLGVGIVLHFQSKGTKPEVWEWVSAMTGVGSWP